MMECSESEVGSKKERDTIYLMSQHKMPWTGQLDNIILNQLLLYCDKTASAATRDNSLCID